MELSVAFRGESRNRPTTRAILDLTYQYSNFGVPGLGLKHGLSEDVVVAPYATALAAMIDAKNRGTEFRRVSPRLAPAAAFGFYEALDYTATRVPENQEVAVVHAYMALARECRSWRSQTSFTTA